MIPLTDWLSEQSLFYQFLKGNERLLPFYATRYDNPEDWEKVLSRLSSFDLKRRNDVAEAIESDYGSTIPGEISTQLSNLKNANSLVIATGQQAGLFGGPLFTLLKALSTKIWSDELSKQFPDYQFIPVFWVEAEDHDFREIAVFHHPDRGSMVFDDPGPTYQSIRKKTIPSSFESFLEEVIATFPESPFRNEVADLLKNCYQPGESFGRAFVRFLRSVLSELGIVVVDPGIPSLKQIAWPVAINEITRQESFKLVSESANNLNSAGFQPLISPKPINLFWNSGTTRHRLEPHPDGFLLTGTDRVKTLEELKADFQLDPEVWSPGVVIRPLVQSYMFPVAGVVTGPSETAYWMQFRELFETNSLVWPVLIPRLSGYVLEPSIARLLEKNNLSVDPVMTEQNWISTELMKASGIPLDTTINSFNTELADIFNKYRDFIVLNDLTLGDSWSSASGKARFQTDQVWDRLSKSIRKKEEVKQQQLDRIIKNLFPDRNWQERKISWIFWYSRHGSQFIRELLTTGTKFPLIHEFRINIAGIDR